MCDEICDYVAKKNEPETWHGEYKFHWNLDDSKDDGGLGIEQWRCPHISLEGEDHCIFHTEPEELPEEVDESEALLDALKRAGESPYEDGPEHKGQFVGAKIGAINLSGKTIVANRHDVRFDHAYICSNEENTSFENTHFVTRKNKCLSFYKISIITEGEGDVSFSGARFITEGEGDVSFSGARFITEGEGDVSFSDARFTTEGEGDVSFSGARFTTEGEGDVSFSDARFITEGEGNVSFSDTNFTTEKDGDILFDSSRFTAKGEGYVSFYKSNLITENEGNVSFAGAQFTTESEGKVSFDRARFTSQKDGDASFDRENLTIVHKGIISFTDTKFVTEGGGNVSFSGARFTTNGGGDILFDRARFITKGEGYVWFSDSEFIGQNEGNVRFTDSNFVTEGKGNLTFSRSEFVTTGRGYIGFNGSVFTTKGEGNLTFAGSKFVTKGEGNLTFAGSEFITKGEGDVNFKESTFSNVSNGSIIFNGINFGDFESCSNTLNEGFSFHRKCGGQSHKKTGDIQFNNSLFQSDNRQNFHNAKFADSVELTGVTFEGSIEFKDWFISEEVKISFSAAEFVESCYFSPGFESSEFKGRIDFSEVIFRKQVQFDGEAQTTDGSETIESDSSNRYDVVFSGSLTFRNATFPDRTNFSNMKFPEDADFAGANLTGVNFSRSDLSGANLERAQLNRAELLGTNLIGAKLYGVLLGDARINHQTAFWPTSDISITNVLLGNKKPAPGRWFSQWKSWLRQGSIPFCRYDPRYDSIDDDLPGYRKGGVEESNEQFRLEKAAEVYGTLETAARDNSLPRLASEAFVGRKDVQRKQYYRKDTHGRQWLMYVRSLVPNLIARYGESPWRVLGYGTLTVILCGLLYWAFDLIETQEGGDPVTLFDSIYFSSLTFTTLGYGDFKPTNGYGQLLAVSETAVGVIMLAILVFVFGRRATR